MNVLTTILTCTEYVMIEAPEKLKLYMCVYKGHVFPKCFPKRTHVLPMLSLEIMLYK